MRDRAFGRLDPDPIAALFPSCNQKIVVRKIESRHDGNVAL
jgi:hypothetical protein